MDLYGIIVLRHIDIENVKHTFSILLHLRSSFKIVVIIEFKRHRSALWGIFPLV